MARALVPVGTADQGKGRSGALTAIKVYRPRRLAVPTRTATGP